MKNLLAFALLALPAVGQISVTPSSGSTPSQQGITYRQCIAGLCAGNGAPIGPTVPNSDFKYTDLSKNPPIIYVPRNGAWVATGSITNNVVCVSGCTATVDSSGTVSLTITGGGVTPTASTPTASPAAGTYSTTQSVALAATGASAIHFAQNATATCASPAYMSAVSVTATGYISAINCPAGYTASAVLTAAYTISGGASLYPQTAPFSAVSLGDNPNLNGFLPYCPSPPNCSSVYQKISSLPVNTVLNSQFHSGTYNYEGAGFNADFGGQTPSLEYHVVKPSTDTAITLIPTISAYTLSTGNYDSESVDTLFPYKPGYTVEGGGTLDTCDQKTGDVHPLIINADNAFLTESYTGTGGTGGYCNGKIQMGNTMVWNLLLPIENQLPGGQTSTDAAGLPLFGLGVRPEEVQAGVIKHAMRVTFPHLQGAFKNSATGGAGGPSGTAAGNDTFALVASPAKHSAGLENANYQTYPGQRLRINPAKDITTCGAQAQIIMQAGKDYGWIVADIGNAFEGQGTYSTYWDQTQLTCMYNTLHASDLQVVSPTPLLAVDLAPETPTYGATITYDQSAKTAYNQGAGPAITAAPIPAITSYSAVCSGGPLTACPIGSTITFTAAATNASNMVIGHAGPIAGASGSVTITPSGTDTYVLSAYNGAGYEVSGNTSGHTAPASITVTMSGTPVATPTSSLASGNYSSNQTATFSTATPGAGLHYTTGSNSPTCASPAVTGPFTITGSVTYNVIGCKSGNLNSTIATYTYSVVIPGATPIVASVSAGSTFNYSPQSVTATFSAGHAAAIAVMWHATTVAPDSVVCGTKAATQVVSQLYSGDNMTVGWYYIPTVDGGSQTCTATNTHSDGVILFAAEISGTSGIDATSVGTAAVNGHVGCGMMTTTGTNRLALVWGGEIYASASASAGYTELLSNHSGLGVSSIAIPTASTTQLTQENSYPGSATCVAIALKP